jgi:hypothetical protein
MTYIIYLYRNIVVKLHKNIKKNNDPVMFERESRLEEN